MPPVLITWVQFVGCLAVIGVAGVQLSRYGDAIADKTGLGGTWVGVMMLGTVTSLPELVTGVSSVTVAGVPEIAVGDVLGSCAFNLLLLVMLDLFYRQESVYTRASHGHVLGGGFGVILLGVVGFALLWSALGGVPALAHVGIYTPAIFLLYAIALRTVFLYSQRTLAEYAGEEPDRYPQLSLSQTLWRYLGAALFVVGAAVWLPFIGERLAATMGWYQSFVGTLFVAFVTSVPELVVTFAAMKLGALDMALGNLVGSNLFNIMILGIDDLFYTAGPLLAHVSVVHTATALTAMAMTGIAIVALLYHPRKRVLHTVGWASVLLAAVFLLNAWVLYRFG
ncbi:MAG TPA: cation transporter [Gammaproteobacteria bacterium]|nr:cation transporter [Gammaproteobacteria bacterium]